MSNKLRRNLIQTGILLSLSISKAQQTAQAKNPASRNRSYAVHKVKFKSQGVKIIGNLFIPESLQGTKAPAITIIGPLAFIKEQSPLHYATRLASEGFIYFDF